MEVGVPSVPITVDSEVVTALFLPTCATLNDCIAVNGSFVWRHLYFRADFQYGLVI